MNKRKDVKIILVSSQQVAMFAIQIIIIYK